jgi:hypothetical protein
MSPLIDVHSLGQVTFADDFGGAMTVDSDLGTDGRWPWVLAILGAALVALGAVAFSPHSDEGVDRAPCAQTVCVPAPGGQPPTR